MSGEENDREELGWAGRRQAIITCETQVDTVDVCCRRHLKAVDRETDVTDVPTRQDLPSEYLSLIGKLGKAARTFCPMQRDGPAPEYQKHFGVKLARTDEGIEGREQKHRTEGIPTL